jgi:cytochrome c biogenesis protein CcmG, thiol:disulfide interchange protein DsbE
MDATDDRPESTNGAGAWWVVPLLVVAAVVLVAVVVLTAPRRALEPQQGPAIGRTIPLLQFEPLTGPSTPVSRDDLKGRVSVVNFWGTWCPPCRLEFPHIVDLASRFGSRDDFKLYAVSCGQSIEEERDTLRSETQTFLEMAKVDLPTYSDPDAATRRALAAVTDGARFGYPTTLVLDRQGVIRGFWSGYSPGTEREIEAVVSQLLE